MSEDYYTRSKDGFIIRYCDGWFMEWARRTPREYSKSELREQEKDAVLRLMEFLFPQDGTITYWGEDDD
jgi:hypothetical protein